MIRPLITPSTEDGVGLHFEWPESNGVYPSIEIPDGRGTPVMAEYCAVRLSEAPEPLEMLNLSTDEGWTRFVYLLGNPYP